MGTEYAKNAYRTFLFWGICSSMGITVCTLIDAILVGNFLGSDGLAVANIATPVFLIYSLLGITLGTGANVQMGRKLGAGDVESANQIFSGVLFAGLAVGVLILTVTLAFGDSTYRFFGATEELLPLVRQYLRVVFFSAPIFVTYHILSVAVRTDGDPKLAAAASVGVIVTNLSLDLLFMKVLGWGILGASTSLCIAEAVGMLILLTHFRKKTALLKLNLKRPHQNELKEFVKNGFGVGSAFIFQAVVMLVFNTLLLLDGSREGVIYVAVFGVMYTISTIPYAVYDGAGSAISTVVSILAGEKEPEGILSVYRSGLWSVSMAGILLTGIFFLMTQNIFAFFALTGDAVSADTVLAFRLYAASLALAGVNALCTAFWQTIGRARLATVMSLMRNCVLMLTVGSVLILKQQVVGLALAYVVSEGVCLLGLLTVRLVNGSKSYVAEKFKLSKRTFEQFYPIEADSIEHVSADLEKLCEDWEIGMKQSFFINLVVEELIMNIVKFGLEETKQKHYVSIKLMENEEEYILRIRDNVNAYNPFDSRGDELDKAAIKLITEKAAYYDYQRKLIFNYLYIIL